MRSRSTSAGKVYRLIDTTGSDTLVPDPASPWSGSYYNCSCTITTPLTIDTNNIYWGGTDGAAKVWTLVKTTKALVANSPFSVGTVASGAAPTIWVSGGTFMFMGSAGHFYKANIGTQTQTTDNNSPGSATVNGRISLINSKVHGADSAGWLRVLDPTTFSTTLGSYHDNTNHHGCTSGVCAITGSLFVDWQTTNVYYGDSDGHLYASYNSTGTTGAQRTGFPYRPGTSAGVFGSAPFFDTNILVAGTTTGNLYIISTASGTPVLQQTFKFGTANAVSGIGYDKVTGAYMISTSNATSKDGKLVYIAHY